MGAGIKGKSSPTFKRATEQAAQGSPCHHTSSLSITEKRCPPVPALPGSPRRHAVPAAPAQSS